MADDVQKLLLQIDASTALLRQEVAKASTSIDTFSRRAEKSADNVTNSFANMTKGLKILAGVVSAGALIGGLKSTINAMDELSKASQKVGTTTEELAKLRRAADLSGVSSEGLEKALIRLNVGLSKIGEKGNDASKALQQIGVEAGSNTLDAMQKIADHFAKLPDGVQKTSEAYRIFGKAGADLIPMLNSGAEGLRAAADEAVRLGLVIDGQTARAAEAFNDNLNRLGKVVDGVSAQIATGLLPALSAMTDALARGASTSGVWVDLGKAIGSSMLAIARAAAVVGVEMRNTTVAIGAAVDAGRALASGEGMSGVQRVLNAADSRIKFNRKYAEAVFDSMQQDMNNFKPGSGGGAGSNAGMISAPTATKTKASARTSRDNDFAPSSFSRGSLINGEEDNLINRLRMAQAALPDIRTNLEALAQYDFSIDLIDRQQLQLAEDYTRTLTEGLAQAVIYGRNFGDVLKGIAQQILSSGLINILSGGKFGSSFGDSLGAIGSIFGGFRAGGGPVSAGKAYVVGEKRPELFVPSTAGYIMPNVPGGGGQGGTTRVVLEPSPLFAVTVIEGATQAARAEVANGIAKATRPRMTAAMGV
jgi:hypothetical protein